MHPLSQCILLTHVTYKLRYTFFFLRTLKQSSGNKRRSTLLSTSHKKHQFRYIYIHTQLLHKFNVHGFVHCKYITIYIQQDATLHSLFMSGNCSTCFGWYLHPSSGTHTTVFTASGICQTVTATCRYSGR